MCIYIHTSACVRANIVGQFFKAVVSVCRYNQYEPVVSSSSSTLVPQFLYNSPPRQPLVLYQPN